MSEPMQFLKSKKNGHVYHANRILLKRKDMVPCNSKGQTVYEQVGQQDPRLGVQAMTAPGVVDAPPIPPSPPQDPEAPVEPEPPAAPEVTDDGPPELLDEDTAKAKVFEWFEKDVSKVTKADLIEYAEKTLQKTLDEKLTKLQMVTEMAKG